MNTTRRTFLGGLAAVSVPSCAAVAAVPTQTAQDENPELLAAYDRFLAARAEVAAAEDALEWLVDEWRHLWPLAPEEILGFANADNYTADAERDIAGRIIIRDTGDFTKRFDRKQREEIRTTCFTVRTPDWFQDVIDKWERPRTGKTKKALDRNRAQQAKVLAEYRRKLRLSEDYHAETARLREASGAANVKARIKAAKAAVNTARLDVSYAHANTLAGLHMKVTALKSDDLFGFKLPANDIFGEIARFIDATLDVIGRASV